MKKKITILGSTGSIGTQALHMIAREPNFVVGTLTANKNTKRMEQQIRAFRPSFVAMADEKAAKDLAVKVADLPVNVSGGAAAVAAAAQNEADIVLSSIVGIAGLIPTVRAIEAGRTIALANKETLVTAGALIMPLAKEKSVPILPVDSEHSAVFQCLQGQCRPEKILLTASGGPFLGKTKKDLETITPKEALKHPNWDMGAKVTIDSASLMNKGLEVMEAAHLFQMDCDDIEVVIHKQSIIHSMVQFCDNSILAQLGAPDMCTPISYALHYPNRSPVSGKKLDLFAIGQLTFEKPDRETFPSLSLAYKAMRVGGTLPAVLNGANEEAVSQFLKGGSGFLQMAELIEAAMSAHTIIKEPSIEEILEADNWAKAYVRERI